MPAEDAIAADVRRQPRLRRERQRGADVCGRAVQEVGIALGLGVEVEELLDSGTQVRVAGTLFVQERAALRWIQFGRLLEQRLHGFGGWLGHVPSRSRAS